MRIAFVLTFVAFLVTACGPEMEAAYEQEISDARGTERISLSPQQQERFDLWAAGGPHGMQTPRYFFIGKDVPFAFWSYCDHHYCVDSPLQVTKKMCDARVAARYGAGTGCLLYAIDGKVVELK